MILFVILFNGGYKTLGEHSFDKRVTYLVTPSVVLTSTQSGFGSDISNLGDVNGDKYPDFVVCCTLGAANCSNYIFFGKNFSTLSAKIETSQLTSTQGIRLRSETRGINTINCAGDINRDGYDDIIVSLYGVAYILYGKANWDDINLDLFDASMGFKVSFSGGNLRGYGVSDIDKDGHVELLLAMPDQKAMYLLWGRDSYSETIDLSFYVTNPNSSNGVHLSPATHSTNKVGDFDNDGWLDILVGSDNDQVSVVYGNFLASKPVKFNVQTIDDASRSLRLFGNQYNLKGIVMGDVNGDSFADFIVSGKDSRGQIIVVSGNNAYLSEVTLTNDSQSTWFESRTDSFGYSIATGDFNGDSYQDILVGAPTYSTNGRVVLLYGNPSFPKNEDVGVLGVSYYNYVDITMNSYLSAGALGTSVAAIDIDNDGFSELLLGADAGKSVFIIKGGSSYSSSSITPSHSSSVSSETTVSPALQSQPQSQLPSPSPIAVMSLVSTLSPVKTSDMRSRPIDDISSTSPTLVRSPRSVLSSTESVDGVNLSPLKTAQVVVVAAGDLKKQCEVHKKWTCSDGSCETSLLDCKSNFPHEGRRSPNALFSRDNQQEFRCKLCVSRSNGVRN